MNNSLFNEIKHNKLSKITYNLEIYRIEFLKKKILSLYSRIKKLPLGLTFLSPKNKLDFIVGLYAFNKAKFPLVIGDHNFLKKKHPDLKYIYQNQKIHKLGNKDLKKYNYDFIFNTSGSSADSKLVLIKNRNISFTCKNLNQGMKFKKKRIDELIYAPVHHAFGFCRIHSLLSSNKNIVLSDYYSISHYLYLKENKINTINGISIPAKILSSILDLGKPIYKKFLNKIKYIHTSTGYLPVSYRKKILISDIDLFINYGMTEAMRSTFLDCKKYIKKINTEGKPFKGISIKIEKNKTQIGRILINGNNVAVGYIKMNEWLQKKKGNYFITDDYGKLDKENFLKFNFRKSDKININGLTFYLNKIEEMIKKKFNLKNLKILKISNQVYLILENKIKDIEIYKFLNKNKINIKFDKIITKKFPKNEIGKFTFRSLKKLI